MLLGFEDAFLAAHHGAGEANKLNATNKTIIIQQNNVFQTMLSKPRREPYSLHCVKPEFRRTFSSILFDAYLLHRARGIRGEFSYRDFLELDHASFRRIVNRLRRKGLVVANPLRTNPRFYVLAEQLRARKL